MRDGERRIKERETKTALIMVIIIITITITITIALIFFFHSPLLGIFLNIIFISHFL